MKAILVVEDELSIRSFICLNLRRKKYKVLEAETGEKAIEMFASSPVDVVLLDLMLPGMDGFTERLITMVEILLDFSRYQSDRVTVFISAGKFRRTGFGSGVSIAEKSRKEGHTACDQHCFFRGLRRWR